MLQELKLMQEKVKVLDAIDSGEISGDKLRELAKHYVEQTYDMAIQRRNLQLQLQDMMIEKLMSESIFGVVYYVPQ